MVKYLDKNRLIKHLSDNTITEQMSEHMHRVHIYFIIAYNNIKASVVYIYLFLFVTIESHCRHYQIDKI